MRTSFASTSLGERMQMVAAVTAALGLHPLASGPGKHSHRLRRDGRPGPLCIKAGLIARGLQFGDPVLSIGSESSATLVSMAS
jgi:hypothetical protein